MRKDRISVLVAILVAGVGLCHAHLALAVGEQVGRIRGVVTNGVTGETLEGVSIEATSPALLGAPRMTMTDRSGRYELLRLPPGSYTLSFSYPGTVAAVRKVTLVQGEAAAVNVEYTLQSQEVESVALTSRQLTRPDSSQTGGVREASSANRLPTGRSYQDLALQVPGSSGGANPYIKGGTTRMNKYLIDGLDVSDPVLSTFAQNLTFDSMQSVEVITGGMDAEYNALGGIINVLTRGGSDQFHSEVSFYANHQKLSAKGRYGPNLYEGFQPLNETTVGDNQSYEGSVNVGGPIIARKLWYGATYEYVFTEASPVKAAPLGVPPFDIQHPARTYVGHHGRFRLAYAPNAHHELWFSASADPATISNVESGNARLGIAENIQKQGGATTLAGWEWTLSDHVVVGIQSGFLYSFLDNGPMGWFSDIDKTGCEKFSAANCTYDRNQPQHINSFDSTTWYQGDQVSIDKRYRLQFDPSVRVKGSLAGNHSLKMGVQTQVLRHTWDYRVPGNSVYTDRSMTPLEGGLCDPANPGPNCFLRDDTDPFVTHEMGYGLGLYVQDRWWTPLRWLTINPGLRADWGYSTDYKDRKATALFGLAPRLGFIADLTQDGRNIFSAFYGRATEPLSLLVSADTSSSEAGVTKTWRWRATSMDNMGWGKEPISINGGPGGLKIASDAKMPHTDEITLSFRRELLPNTVGSVEYTWKRISNAWALIEQNRIWDPTGSRVVGYVDPAAAGHEVYLYTTPSDPRLYRGLIFSTEGQPTPRWDYSASYTLSWTTLEESADNPRLQQFYRGYSTADIRHFFRLYASYDVTDHLQAGGSFEYQSGTPMTKGFFNYEIGDYSNRRSPSGTTPTVANDAKSFSEFRIPDLMQLDLRLKYQILPSRLQHRLSLVADVFNALNQATPTGVVSDDIQRFGQVSSRQRPRRIQVGLAYTY